ncbi:hypothetical protein [Sphaerisporangium sp. TRM90804]|uniref:hypothetical protein n=1 Tax=Sphaerisporangium sp. TRM90804 TaxID=3031113 RepID=UPI002448ABFC|nr:hypothetical protein [Sphaerisporangium sp. TRM90804]MDH2430367.1 hypothetical protein [Sphaerisporangium sp. TRM90804]
MFDRGSPWTDGTTHERPPPRPCSRPSRFPFTRRPAAGRHRRGTAAQPEHRGPEGRRKVWDARQRARAEQLGLLEPGWLVMYGAYSRRFYAIARISEVCEPLLQAATPEELRTLMRGSELAGLAPARRSRTGRPAGDGLVRPGSRP